MFWEFVAQVFTMPTAAPHAGSADLINYKTNLAADAANLWVSAITASAVVQSAVHPITSRPSVRL